MQDELLEMQEKMNKTIIFITHDFNEDSPGAYQILDNFFWELDDMESVRLEISVGTDPKATARNWIETHPEKVSQWIK